MKWLATVLMFAGMLNAQQLPQRGQPNPVGPLSVFMEPSNHIPKEFFGMVTNNANTYPLLLTYGNWRGWDSGMSWINVEQCKASSGNPSDHCFSWTVVDRILAATFQQGIQDGLFTFSRTPPWAVDLNSDPTGGQGKNCNYYIAPGTGVNTPGQCLTPTDLNKDGSGTNQMWKNWVTAFVTHVNDPTYLKTHSHIQWWEPWNEFGRSTTLIDPPYTGTLSYEGTYAQLVRLTEDMQCIITGKGTIHNFPVKGSSTPCKATAIDSGAQISTPSGGIVGFSRPSLQNFLYCNASPPAGSECTTNDGGSKAVDGINAHYYSNTTTPEVIAFQRVPLLRGILSQDDLKKPFFNGEGSWGNVSNDGNIWTDKYAQAGFIPRYFALNWTQGLMTNYWYAYNQAGATGGLFDTNTNQLLHPQSDAWQQTTSWLIGSISVNNQFCQVTGTVYTCEMKLSNGKAAELVWDSAFGQNCSQMSQPLICGNTVYSVPVKYNGTWIDLMGVSHSLGQTVVIGANPILLKAK